MNEGLEFSKKIYDQMFAKIICAPIKNGFSNRDIEFLRYYQRMRATLPEKLSNEDQGKFKIILCKPRALHPLMQEKLGLCLQNEKLSPSERRRVIFLCKAQLWVYFNHDSNPSIRGIVRNTLKDKTVLRAMQQYPKSGIENALSDFQRDGSYDKDGMRKYENWVRSMRLHANDFQNGCFGTIPAFLALSLCLI